MKKLSKISLHNLSQAELAKREENLLKGGNQRITITCYSSCPCAYAGEQEDENDSHYEGASTIDNADANLANNQKEKGY